MTLTLTRPTPETGDTLLADALSGLAAAQKTLPAKLFYDRRGSELFDAICELPEYYPTRTETAIMQAHAPHMAAFLGDTCRLVELGSGSSVKTRVLLDAAPRLHSYVPVDISREHLMATARDLQDAYPHLDVRPVAADYTRPFDLPRGESQRTVAYFPGSTVGNFTPPEAEAFLTGVRQWADGLLVGVDMKKDIGVLEAAYNDKQGVTAAFNLNILERMNTELGADFDLSNFAHWAFYNPYQGRVEMHLLSLEAQTVHMGGQAIAFHADETIHTENSYKWDADEFAALAGSAGWRPRQAWTDERGWFSVQSFNVA